MVHFSACCAASRIDEMPPPVSSTMWNKTKTKIHKASQAVAEEMMHRAASKLSDGTGGSSAVIVSCGG